MAQETYPIPTAEEEKPGPPLPAWLFKYVLNPLMKLMLRSPLHGRISEDLILLEFNGRKTGKRYSFPVGYRREGDVLDVVTFHGWWPNFKEKRPVTVWLRGEKRRGQAWAITDKTQIARMVREEMEKYGMEFAARRFQMSFDQMPTVAEIADKLRYHVIIRIELN